MTRAFTQTLGPEDGTVLQVDCFALAATCLPIHTDVLRIRI